MTSDELQQPVLSPSDQYWLGERKKNFFDLEQFRSAIRVDAFERVVVEGQGAEFFIEGWPRKRVAAELEAGARMVLCTSRKKRARLFRRLEGALKLLKELGAKSVEVHLSRWHPAQRGSGELKRPDMSKRLRFAHARGRSGEKPC